MDGQEDPAVASSPPTLQLDATDIQVARDLGLLRIDVRICADTSDDHFGEAYDHAQNLCETTFESRTSLQQRCREFAARRGFSLRVSSTSWSSKRREGNAKYVCKLLKGQQQLQVGTVPACPFYINVYGKNDHWKITKVQFLHDHYRFSGFQSQTFIEGGLGADTRVMRQRDMPFSALVELVRQEMLPAYDHNWGSVTGSAIVEWMRTKRHEINAQMASRLKTAVQDILQGDMEESYQKLESFLKIVARANKGSHYSFDKDGNDEDGYMFKRACLFPSSCLHALKHCKPIIGLDGTHLKGEMNKRGVYLVATTKDFNNHIIVVGLALVPVENYENWSWFLRQLQEATIGTTFNPVFISDRQKGLIASVNELFPHCVHRYCLRHIIGNIAKLGHQLSPDEQAIVFKLARAESEYEFEANIAKLRVTRPKAAEYLLKNISKEHWVMYAMHEMQENAQLSDPSTPRLNYATFDEVTSNLSETANNWIGNDCRSAKPLHAFEDYMIKVVRQFATRRRQGAREMGVRATDDISDDVAETEARNLTTSPSFDALVPVYQRKLDNLMQVAKASEILPCFVEVVMVRFTEARHNGRPNHEWRAVNLEERECTCRKWQDQKFPCVHAVQVAIRNNSHVSTLFDWDRFTVSSFMQTYSYQFVPVSATATLHRDVNLRVPPIQIAPEDRGKRGRKPGPKPKHKRRNARFGSAAANPNVSVTQS